MWFLTKGHAILACLVFLQIVTTLGSPQNGYYQSPNGQLRPLPLAQTVCGDCPSGTQREPASGPYCGRCIPSQQSCAPGYYKDANGHCQSCPCPDASGSRRFGTTCRVDVDGQVTCDCPSEYTGRDCSQCAPGTIQSNVPPYNCIRINSTNSFAVTCPAGNNCPQPNIPQIIQQRPQLTQPVCPFTQQQPQQVQYQQQPQAQIQQQPQPQYVPQPVCPFQNNATCPTNPNPCGVCPTNQCPTACGPSQCPVTCPTQPITCPTPPTRPPWTPPPPPPCPGPIQCPVNPQTPCPINPITPCPISPTQGPPPPQTQCPINPITPCPISPTQGPPPPPIVCPTNPPQIINPPPVVCPTQPPPPVIRPPPWTTPRPTCPGPIPCPPPVINPPPPPPVTCPIITPPVTCSSPCQNNQCQQCPEIPPCPPCPPVQCPQCPIIDCPPCIPQNCENVNCPNPCQPCPQMCPPCPPNPQCPDCRVSCPECPRCPGVDLYIEPCICDPRGTASQSGSQCVCKVNAQGATCDNCKKGYFGLSSLRPEGCLSCFCSGLTDSCSAAIYYRSLIRTDRSSNCTIELTNEDHSVVYSQGSAGFNWDGQTATYNKGANRRLFWSLPSCLKGDRVTSYGGYLSFTRMCTGSGNPLGADHEVMLVGGSGATIFWTTFQPQACDGNYNRIEVLLAESAYWSSWKGETYRRATRADIMEVLANLQLILIRATLTSNTMTTSIKEVTLSTVTKSQTAEGIILEVESCRCPTGYRGLSCENCAPGYYRDTSDMSRSVFGACKPCPCGKTAEGCHLSGGQVVCICKQGFTGPLCQDKEVITITCDPFRIREVEGAEIDFTCSFTTNSKRRLLMRLGREGSPDKAEETTSLTRTITLDKSLRRVACEVVDNGGVTWAVVYCAVELIQELTVPPPPLPRIIAVIPTETFICINETQSVTMTCDVHSFGQRRVDIEWRREGSTKIMANGKQMTLHNAAVEDSGTYICAASDGEVAGAGQVALMVRRISYGNMLYQYPVNASDNKNINILQLHGGDYPNYPYQSIQADAPAGNGTVGSSKVTNNLPPGHPKAIVEPSEIIAKPGDTVILRCNATGEEPLKFYWKSGNNDYIPVHVRVSHGALIFRKVQSHDAGPYYCVAWNHLGQSTARATIIMDTPTVVQNQTNPQSTESEPLNIEILHAEISARPGENVNFLCKSNTTGVKYQWDKLGEKMPNSSEVRNDGLLTLYRVSEPNKGTYVCTVTAPNGEQKTAQGVLKLKPLTTEILVPPRITIKPKSPLRVRTGSKVRIECETLGNPLPNVTWFRSIDGVDKKLVSTSINKATYEIKQMTSSDVGKYTCNAVNTAGKKSESMSLLIDDGLPCKESEFRCKSGDQCIPREDRCDKEKDCRDGSDELNCKSRRSRRSLHNA